MRRRIHDHGTLGQHQTWRSKRVGSLQLLSSSSRLLRPPFSAVKKKTLTPQPRANVKNSTP
eukprot:914986-Rhodomonas_salina.5